MTDRHSEPDDDAEELDENGEQLSRLTPLARHHLAAAREALKRGTDTTRRPA
jgi:hypothetical protein